MPEAEGKLPGIPRSRLGLADKTSQVRLESLTYGRFVRQFLTFRGVLVLLASGALSGSLVACLITATGWLKYGLPHVIIPVGQDSNGMVRYADVTGTDYYVFLVQWMSNDAAVGLCLGLLGGAVAVVVSLYWRGATRVSGAALFWAVVGASGGLLLTILVDGGDDNGIARAAYLVIGGAAIGAAFGTVLAVFARLFSKILGSGEAGRYA